MRVLVTGGAGYIGSHTVKALCEYGHEPIILDNLSTSKDPTLQHTLGVPFINTCISNKKEISEIIQGKHSQLKGTIHEDREIQALIHFAAFSIVHESVADPISYYKNNVAKSIDLLDAIYKTNQNFNKKPIPFIFSSTCSTYGMQNSFPITEGYSQKPLNPYAKSKYFFEEIIKDLSKSLNFKSVALRYFNVAGASKDLLIGEDRDHETHLIPLAIKTALGLNDYLSIFGNDYDTPDGTCIRDYIHVCDVADAHVKAMELIYAENNLEGNLKKNNLNNFEAFNLGIGEGYSVKEIIDVTEKITKTKLNIRIKKRRLGDPPILLASNKKFKEKFAWEPKNKDISVIIEDSYKWQKKLYKTFF